MSEDGSPSTSCPRRRATPQTAVGELLTEEMRGLETENAFLRQRLAEAEAALGQQRDAWAGVLELVSDRLDVLTSPKRDRAAAAAATDAAAAAIAAAGLPPFGKQVEKPGAAGASPWTAVAGSRLASRVAAAAPPTPDAADATRRRLTLHQGSLACAVTRERPIRGRP